jgi:hypothetical protein
MENPTDTNLIFFILTSVCMGQPAVDVTGTVLIVGLIVLVIIIVGFVVIYGQHSTALNQAARNLEDSITILLASFERFGVTVASSLTRLVTHLRDLFESFLGNLSSSLATSLTFFGNAFQRVFGSIEHIGTAVGSQYVQLYTNTVTVITELSIQITGKMTTLPADIGLRLILAFVSLVTEGIQTITCFALTAVNDIISAFQTGFTVVESFFTTSLQHQYNEIVGAITPTLSYISSVVAQLPADIFGIPQQVYNLISPALNSIQDSFDFIICQAFVPICHILPDDHTTCEQLRCAGKCNDIANCCSPCCPC